MSAASASHGLTGVASTLLTPLYGRAHARRLLPSTDFSDPLATAVLERTGYRPSEVLTDRSNALGSLHRAIVLDRLTTAFTTEHPDATVVSVGIGLCTRNARLADRVPDSVRWVGIDTPDVMTLRRRLLPDRGIDLHAASVTDPDWTAALPAEPGPTLVIAEGLLMSLAPQDVAGFLDRTHRALGPGTELLADLFHPWVVRSGRHPIVKATGARFHSGYRGCAGLAAAAPGWQPLGEHGVMERISPAHRATAYAFRLVGLGHPRYTVARLRAVARPTAAR
ncbi:class I SAM-dependent methyltransferase [Kitasatospora sp. NPDC088346]|uniref:class I SAM-dependent methyltransferase n=1 Tax=Kitasatospora sp. NPDC088346 TaxID=3364073 RepID=UPI0038270A5B